MCLAMPMKIKTVSGQVADCEAGGLTQQIRVDFENLRLLEEIKNAL